MNQPAASAGAYQAVLKPIEGTILTVVRESAEAAKAASAEGASLVDVLHDARARTDADSAYAQLFALWNGQYQAGAEDACTQALASAPPPTCTTRWSSGGAPTPSVSSTA